MEGRVKELAILLMEDNAADVYLIKAALAECTIPHTLEIFRNGTQMWEYLERVAPGAIRKPDLAVLDLNVPGMNGREVLAKLAENPALTTIPIAVFSGSASEQDIASDFTGLRLSFGLKTSDFEQFKETICGFTHFARSYSRLGPPTA